MTDLNICTDTVRMLLLGLVLAGSGGDGVAALGNAPSIFPAGSSASPMPGPKALAARSAVQSNLYTLHEVQLEDGTTVREYATPAGLVFAISWRGPVLPDLRALLGDYFSTFKLETDQARMTGRRGSPVNMEGAGLVVRSNGRMRNFFGHAYAPALIPVGVNIKDVLQ
ncbi:DUF2844 domain-containing protein [Rhodoferax sp.]|uniref:DUF2844 domain-containing protein n=1 Tax=Rhodoferax sp. TaxID=50421 RepID=UPI00272359F1|nr:DUF2844 domain-containing protein [Rhodoferax sp.]MDO9198614.1 DUF2844 domain-containing protein [Rhodoferax sp.]